MPKENLPDVTYHNAKLWQIGLFSLNNCATNLALFLMMQYSYFTQNVLGLAAVVVGAIATATRIFDGVTDPIIGFFVDKTNSRFGRFRPFMLIGNLIIIGCMIGIFCTPQSFGATARYIYTTVLYFLYVIGYTCQTICTKAGQAVLTNNPKQRPIFSGFDGVLTQLANMLVPLLITTILAQRYSVGDYAPDKGLINPDMWRTAVFIISGISFVFTILAMIGISQKDRPKYYNAGDNRQKVRFSDYLEIIGHNRPIQMLIISAATDKLGQLLMTGVMTYVFANLLLDVTLQGIFSSVLTIPLIVISVGGVFLARRLGLKKTFMIGTWGSMIALAAMFLVRPNPSAPWIFLTLFLIQKCVASMGSAAVIPMIADCTDYETYRSGRFVPSMMGTMFSFIDKMISSASTLLVGIALAAVGVGHVVITPNQPVSGAFDTAILSLFCIVPFLGHVASVIAMRFYKLDAKEMEHIQKELAERHEKQSSKGPDGAKGRPMMDP